MPRELILKPTCSGCRLPIDKLSEVDMEIFRNGVICHDQDLCYDKLIARLSPEFSIMPKQEVAE